jgi:hypothetical protein
MPGSAVDNAAISLAESIALLALLDNVLDEPTAIICPASRRTGDGRQLSLDQERNLAAALATLSGISDDSGHVMALSIEERVLPMGMCIKLAINKAQPHDGDEILGKVAVGFRRIFAALSKAQSQPENASILQLKAS